MIKPRVYVLKTLLNIFKRIVNLSICVEYLPEVIKWALNLIYLPHKETWGKGVGGETPMIQLW